MKVNQLFEEPKIVSRKAYGPVLKKFGRAVPQFAADEATAKNLQSYYELGKTIEKVSLSWTKAAKNKNVEAAAKAAGLNISWDEVSHAQEVASNQKLRKALQTAGFDAYADRSVLENTEPMQFVVFDATQVLVAKYKE